MLHTCDCCPKTALDSFPVQLLLTPQRGWLKLLVSILDILMFTFLSDLAWLLSSTCAPLLHVQYNYVLSSLLFSFASV
jgi:hypothetical protein